MPHLDIGFMLADFVAHRKLARPGNLTGFRPAWQAFLVIGRGRLLSESIANVRVGRDADARHEEEHNIHQIRSYCSWRSEEHKFGAAIERDRDFISSEKKGAAKRRFGEGSPRVTFQ